MKQIKSILLLSVILFSCTSEKHLAKVCAEKFPVKDSTIIVERVDTTYQLIKGDSIRIYTKIYDSLFFIDTICPPVKCPQITKVKEKIVYQENTARVDYLWKVNGDLYKEIEGWEKENKALQEENKTLKKFRNTIYLLFTLIVLVVIGITYLRTIKFI